MTPEGRVKAQVKRVLDEREENLWQYWPVPFGMGVTTLDCIGCYYGKMFAIETKGRADDKPTQRQLLTMEDIALAGAPVFLIKGLDSPVLGHLRSWLTATYEKYAATHGVGPTFGVELTPVNNQWWTNDGRR